MIPVKGNNLTFFSGRKFRNGWMNKNCFTILNTINTIEDSEGALDAASIYNGREANDGSTSIIQIVQIKSMQNESDSTFAKSIEEHLNIELKHDKRHQVEGSDCPFLESNGGTFGLNEHFLLAKKLSLEIDSDTEKYNESVWTLINALWGYREELESEEPTAHTTIMFRRDLFSEWIENVVTDKDALKKNKDYLDQLLSLILCHKVSDACELAFINDDVNLAMLLSQLSGGPAVRQLLQHQLSSWQEVQADKFISTKRLKALMMVAGVSALASQHGPINIFEQLDWIKSLAVSCTFL